MQKKSSTNPPVSDLRLRAELEQVKSRTLPHLDDSSAQSMGEYERIGALRVDIRNNLETESRDAYNSEYDDLVVSAIVEKSELKYPPQMLEDEIDDVLEQLERRLKAQNLDIETYLKTRQMDRAALHEEVRPGAEDRLKRSLVLIEISEKENIQVEKEELQSETERTLDAMTRFMSESELKKLSLKELLQNLVGNIIGESIARLFEFGSATLYRHKYPSDIGLSVAKAVWGIQQKHGNPDSVNPNQEMIGLGAANLATGFFQGFSISSSSSRTPVAEASGSKTQLTGITGAIMIALLLIFAPTLLQNLPNTALAAVVIASAIGLFEIKDLRRLYRIQRWEFWLSIACFLGVAFLGPIPGMYRARNFLETSARRSESTITS